MVPQRLKREESVRRGPRGLSDGTAAPCPLFLTSPPWISNPSLIRFLFVGVNLFSLSLSLGKTDEEKTSDEEGRPAPDPLLPPTGRRRHTLQHWLPSAIGPASARNIPERQPACIGHRLHAPQRIEDEGCTIATIQISDLTPEGAFRPRPAALPSVAIPAPRSHCVPRPAVAARCASTTPFLRGLTLPLSLPPGAIATPPIEGSRYLQGYALMTLSPRPRAAPRRPLLSLSLVCGSYGFLRPSALSAVPPFSFGFSSSSLLDSVGEGPSTLDRVITGSTPVPRGFSPSDLGLERECRHSVRSPMAIQFLLLISRQGKVRLTKWYHSFSSRDKARITREVSAMVLGRNEKLCNFLDYQGGELVFKRYASLFFVMQIDKGDNELITLETIHFFVEILDKYFGNVCELDVIYNFDKVYYLVDEIFIAGRLIEPSCKDVLIACGEQDQIVLNAESK